MFRKKTCSARQNNKPVSDDTFDRITIGAKKKGAYIIRCEYGDETFLHLEKNKANACCIGDTLIFRPDATISEVLEETYHFEQNLVEMNIDKEPILKTILNEIDAKEYLLQNAKKFSIPRTEIEETEEHLKQYKKQLEDYMKGIK